MHSAALGMNQAAEGSYNMLRKRWQQKPFDAYRLSGYLHSYKHPGWLLSIFFNYNTIILSKTLRGNYNSYLIISTCDLKLLKYSFRYIGSCNG